MGVPVLTVDIFDGLFQLFLPYLIRKEQIRPAIGFRLMQDACFQKCQPPFLPLIRLSIIQMGRNRLFSKRRSLPVLHRPEAASLPDGLRLLLRHGLRIPEKSSHRLIDRTFPDLLCQTVPGFLKGKGKLLFRKLQRAVPFQPLPGGMRRHRNAAVLGLAQTCLNLHVTAISVRKEFLPVPSGRSVSPGKQLSGTQPVRGQMQQAVTGGVRMRNVFGSAIRNIEEIVHRSGNIFIMGNVRSVYHWNGDLVNAPVAEGEGLGRRHQNPPVLLLRHGDVAPPVHGRYLLTEIDDPHSRIQKAVLFSQPEIHLPGHLTDPLILIHAQNRRPVRQAQLRRKKRGCGKWRMTDHAHIPFHATRKPGIPHRKVGEPQHLVGIQKASVRLFVPEAPEPSAVFRKEHRLQIIIFQNRGLHIFLPQPSGIAGELPVGPGACQPSIALIDFVLFIQEKFHPVLQYLPIRQIRNGRFLI